jgi:glutaminyl-tRNA synthetase
VRLAGAYLVRCEEAVPARSGDGMRLRCRYDPGSLSGEPSERKRGQGTLHWVEASRSVSAAVRLYDRLFRTEQPDAEGDFLSALNPDSLVVARRARLEPALAAAAPGSRYQFLRQGYFFADPVDSSPGAPVWSRTISLKDTWASRGARATAERRPRAGKRPAAPAGPAPGRPRGDRRSELRAKSPELAARFARYRTELGLPEDEADRLAGDLALAGYFDAALAAHGNARSLARWLLNELLGLSKDRRLDSLPLDAPAFGRFVSLVDAGRVTPASGKALLASLLERPGEPAARMEELGLGKVDDRGAIEAAVARVLEAHRAETERYRAGEKKLLGVLLGAAMRETQGTADPALVRELLVRKLG